MRQLNCTDEVRLYGYSQDREMSLLLGNDLLKSFQVAFADRFHINLFPDDPFRFFSHFSATFGRFEHLSDSFCQAVGISVLKEVSVSAFHDQVAFRAVAYGTKNRHPVRHGVIDRNSSRSPERMPN